MAFQEIPTPNLGHLSRQDYQFVYEPAEDTFLFLDALEADQVWLRERGIYFGLEIGPGSGCVVSFAQKVLPQAVFLAIDVNEKACMVTKRTVKANQGWIEVLQGDLLNGIQSRRQFDLILFNPPYVVTSSEEVGGNGIEASWAGGVDGREVLDRLLGKIEDVLSDVGVFYLVTIEENKPGEILERFKGFYSERVKRRRAGREDLSDRMDNLAQFLVEARERDSREIHSKDPRRRQQQPEEKIVDKNYFSNFDTNVDFGKGFDFRVKMVKENLNVGKKIQAGSSSQKE